MRILVVEDDGQLGPQLKALLVAGRFAVDLVVDGQAGLFQGSEYPYDAAIIDVGLPGINGIELIRRLRAAGRNFPILILTARGHWQDKVEGLEAGADDYLTKPFQPEELLARLNALLRRAAGLASPELRAGPLLLSTARKRVSPYTNYIPFASRTEHGAQAGQPPWPAAGADQLRIQHP